MHNAQIIHVQPLAIDNDNPITKAIKSVPDDHLPVIEMFYGIEGEGLLVGEPRILLRIGGCRVACTGCDTPHSWGLKSSVIKPLATVIEDLLALVAKTGVRTVAITGGEPMHYPKQIAQIANALNAANVCSWLETSGLIFDIETMRSFAFISLDVKTPSSGPAALNAAAVSLFKSQVRSLRVGQIKFIVTDQADVDWINLYFSDWLLDGTPLVQHMGSYTPSPVVITPACGRKSTLQDIADRVVLASKAWSAMPYVRIIAQQHAMLHLP